MGAVQSRETSLLLPLNSGEPTLKYSCRVSMTFSQPRVRGLTARPSSLSRIQCTEVQRGSFIVRTFLIKKSCSQITPVSWDLAFVSRTPLRGFGPRGRQSLSRREVFRVNIRNLWHHARPRRATPYRRTVGATVLFSLRGYAGVWSLHIGAVPVSIL